MTKAANLAALSSGPAFSAYRNTTNQMISSSTWTKMQFQGVEYDTASAYDAVTTYQFNPKVAGYYLVVANIDFSASTGATSGRLGLFKNGSAVKYGNTTAQSDTNVVTTIYFNGTTDYLELYAYIVASTAGVSAGAQYSYLQASLARAA